MSVASPTPWPHNTGSPGQTFQARRPFSSNEFLALRKKAIEQALNAPPINTVNLQNSSEQTARVRKLASRDSDALFKIGGPGLQSREPTPVMRGGGTVPNRTSANVLARQQGNVYSATYFNYQPRQDYQSTGCATLLNDNVTFPKAVECAEPQFRPGYHVVQPFSQRIRFGMTKNSNKTVIAAQNLTLPNNTGRCAITTLYPTGS
jgi:hypothetical protein